MHRGGHVGGKLPHDLGHRRLHLRLHGAYHLIHVAAHGGLQVGLDLLRELGLHLTRVDDARQCVAYELLCSFGCEVLVEARRRLALLYLLAVVGEVVFLDCRHERRRRFLVDGRLAADLELRGVHLGCGGKVARGARQIERAHVDRKRVGVDLERRLQLAPVDGEQGAHVEARALGVRFFHERLAGEDVRRAVRQLIFDDLRVCRLVDDVAHHVARVVEAGLQRGDLRARLRLHDAADVHVFSRVNQVAHVIGVVAFVLPHVVVGIVLIVVGGGDQLERHAHELVVRERHVVVGRVDLFLVGERAHHVVELAMVAQSHGVEHEVAHLATGSEHEHDVAVALRPCARHDVVLVPVKIGVTRHLVEDVGGHHRGHDAVGGSGRSEPDGGKGLVGVDLPHAVFDIGAEQLWGDVVAVLDGIHVLVDSRIAVVKVFL